jgi:phosphonate transport system permease protein
MKNLLSKFGSFIKKIINLILPKPKAVTLENGTIVEPPRSASLYISIILLVILVYFTQITEFNIVRLFVNFTNIFEFIARILTPDWSYSSVVIPKVLETIRMAFLGTFVGAIFSLPVAFIISSNINKNAKWIGVSIKIFLSLLRTFPMLVYARIILLLFTPGSGPVVGTISITIFTFSILTKMLYEHIETLDLSAYEAIESTGVTKVKAFLTAVMPDILPVYFSFALYSFDINIRHSTILGYVGAGGIGVILKRTLQGDQYEKAGMILVIVFVAILSIEALSKYIRKRLS